MEKKTNPYFRRVLRRENKLKQGLLDFFLRFCSYPRLLLEVFIRRNFGQRYFSAASAITVGVLLALLPLGLRLLPDPGHYDSYEDMLADQGWHFWLHYIAWYLFLAVYGYFAWVRSEEIKRNPGVLDFGKFSLYSGDIDFRFFSFQPLGKRPSVRQVETLIEPGLFFCIGLALWLIGQRLGVLLLVSSIFYSLGYAGAYAKGDNFVMDKIDEMILNEELEETFVDGAVNPRRGVRFYGVRPDDRNLRQKLADGMFGDEDTVEDVTYAE